MPAGISGANTQKADAEREFNQVYTQAAAPVYRCKLLAEQYPDLKNTKRDHPHYHNLQESAKGKREEIDETLENLKPIIKQLEAAWVKYSPHQGDKNDPIVRRHKGIAQTFQSVTENWKALLANEQSTGIVK